MVSSNPEIIWKLRDAVADYSSALEMSGRKVRSVIAETDLQLRRLYEGIDRALDESRGDDAVSAAHLRKRMELVKARSQAYAAARRSVLDILDGKSGDSSRVASYLWRLGTALDGYTGIALGADDSVEEETAPSGSSGGWPDFKAPRIPTEKTGHFLGTPGESGFVPYSEEAKSLMSEYGRGNVEYRGGYPDFSPFIVHETPFGCEIECQVEIGHMTTARENPSWEFGRRPVGTSHNADFDLGNFAQADLELARLVIAAQPEIVLSANRDNEKEVHVALASAIESWRRREHLTWHEVQDGRSMQLVPEAIHAACPHTGGVSVMDVVQQYGDVDRIVPGEEQAYSAYDRVQAVVESTGRRR